MRARATKLSRRTTPVFDTCGTGGDGAHTFNVSTVAALVLAACGVRVAKHGNRSASRAAAAAPISSRALGVNIAAPPAVVERCLDEAGIAFFFAQTFHPSMKHAAPTRKELGVRTAFNLLGPLTNPAGADAAARRRAAAGADRARRAFARCSSDRSARGSCTAPTASTRSRRRATRRCRSAATARSTRSTCIRPTSGCRKSAPDGAARAATPRTTPAIARAMLGGDAGPRARHRAAERRRRRCSLPGARVTIPEGIAMARRRHRQRPRGGGARRHSCQPSPAKRTAKAA